MDMANGDVQSWLRDGIAAVKAGNKIEARRLLLKVVESDEQNEQAWLWLSGVVETDNDRRVCLENVLTLNPQHELARRGLEKLERAAQVEADARMADADIADTQAEDAEIIVRKEYAPISPAAAVLYPERQVKEWRYRDPTNLQQAPEVGIASVSTYDDVWSQETAVCGYCAQEIDEDASQCPRCQHNLIEKRYRYEKPSTNLHLFWILLAGLGQFFLIQALYAMIIERVLYGAILAGVWMVAFLILAVGVYYRQTWAHIGTIFACGLLLLLGVINVLLPLDFSTLEVQLTGIDPSIANFIGPFAQGGAGIIRALQMGTAVLALIFAFLLVTPDFDKVDEQLRAQLDKGLQYGSDYHAAARKYVQKGLLATAVLHWQRAAAKEPHQLLYLRYLGMTYAQLGFYERSLDTFNSALQFTTDSVKKEEFKQLMQKVSAKREA